MLPILAALAGNDPTDDWKMGIEGSTHLLTGVRDDAGMHLATNSFGLGFVVHPTLRVRTHLLLVTPAGTDTEGTTGQPGFGGQLAFRLDPLPHLIVRPHVRLGLGIAFFPREPFLPGGDVYDFVLDWGAGFTTQLSPRWDLSVEVLTAHLSNGQGLGPHNPAYDGIGGGLSLSWSLGDRPEQRPTPPPRRWGRSRWTPGGVATSAVLIDGAVIAQQSLAVHQRLAGPLAGWVEGSVGTLAKLPAGSFGGGLAAHGTLVSGGLGLTHGRYAGLGTTTVSAQAEAHVSEPFDLLATGFHRRGDLDEGTTRAAIAARLWFTDRVTLSFGAGGHVHDRGVRADPVVAFEGQIPLRSEQVALSLFAERRLEGVHALGLRFAWGLGGTLRDEARAEGFRMLR